ncbi:MAG: isochorismatase family protein [Syntrophobacterales bacterium]|jgi:nicotinamidase-related amidase|nr:isochorismatase family protein [Syntrophobacterales bacterium]
MGNTFDQKKMITRDDCLLVIIDAQEKLMPALSHGDEITANLVRLAQFSRIIGFPVIVTEQEKLGATLTVIKDHLSGLEPVKKVHFNCFSSHDFNDRILASGRKTIILAGAEAHICVAQTALGAPAGYTVHVAADAISSRTVQNREIALRRMLHAGCVITSTEMFMYEILRKAGTDEFKAVLPLVK